MRRSIQHLLVVAAGTITFAVAGNAQAEATGKRFRHADRNKDGHISGRELRKEKRFEKVNRAKVDTPKEAKADRNKDGIVGPKEARRSAARDYLKDRSEVDKKWEAKADRDDDGVVDGKELRTFRKHRLDKNSDGKVDATERRAFWQNRKTKVNTPIEKRYDEDGNGYLSRKEAGELLRDRLRVINTHGKAKVNTDLEREFDADGDGIINKDEAQAIRDAIAAD